MRKASKLIVVFTCFHGCAAIVGMFLSMGSSNRAFDGGDPQSSVEQLIARTTDVLLLPASWLWTPWASKHLPDALEWCLFLANSVLWGALLTALILSVERRVTEA